MSRTRARIIVASAFAGAALFFAGGRWAFDALAGYGFEIFSPTTLSQDLALWLALAISLPTGAFSDALPVSRALYAVNGAAWGILLSVLWLVGVSVKRRMRKTGATRS